MKLKRYAEKAQAEIDRLQTLVDTMQPLLAAITATEFEGIQIDLIDERALV